MHTYIHTYIHTLLLRCHTKCMYVCMFQLSQSSIAGAAQDTGPGAADDQLEEAEVGLQPQH